MPNTNQMKTFQGQIFKYGAIIAILCELLSLPFLGWSPQFAYGLALGTCVAVVNYSILTFSAKKIIYGGKGASMAVLSYVVRLIIYGGAFYMSYQIGTVSGLATLLGYMTLKMGMYYTYGFKPKFSTFHDREE